MFCIVCNEDKQPVHALQPSGRVLAQCPCGNTYPIVEEPIPELALGTTEVWKSLNVARPLARARAPLAERPANDEPCDVLTIAKERLIDVKAQLAALEPLKREEALLERMIWAAESNE